MLDEATTLSDEEVRRIVREELDAARKREPASRKAAIIASKRTLDW